MIKIQSIVIACAGRIALTPLVTSSARADAIADFYKGKTVTLVVAFGAGGM